MQLFAVRTARTQILVGKSNYVTLKNLPSLRVLFCLCIPTFDSLEKTLMLGGIGGKRRRGRQRMRWLDGITDSKDVVSVNSGSWWWTGRPGGLRFMGSQRVGHDWATDLIWSEIKSKIRMHQTLQIPKTFLLDLALIYRASEAVSKPRRGLSPFLHQGSSLQESQRRCRDHGSDHLLLILVFQVWLSSSKNSEKSPLIHPLSLLCALTVWAVSPDSSG